MPRRTRAAAKAEDQPDTQDSQELLSPTPEASATPVEEVADPDEAVEEGQGESQKKPKNKKKKNKNKKKKDVTKQEEPENTQESVPEVIEPKQEETKVEPSGMYISTVCSELYF
jgi:hypothetical protein